MTEGRDVMRQVGLLLVVLGMMFGCSRGGGESAKSEPPHVLTDRTADALRGAPGNAPPDKALGEDCLGRRAQACHSGLCIKSGSGRGRGYFCSRECETQTDCPTDWLCRQAMPGPHGMLCVPPDNWTSRAVGVRP